MKTYYARIKLIPDSFDRWGVFFSKSELTLAMKEYAGRVPVPCELTTNQVQTHEFDPNRISHHVVDIQFSTIEGLIIHFNVADTTDGRKLQQILDTKPDPKFSYVLEAHTNELNCAYDIRFISFGLGDDPSSEEL